MPTLIRMIIALLFLGGLGLAAMVALTVFVDPGEKEITVRIPARDLVATPTDDPLVDRTPSRPVEPQTAAENPEPIAPGAASDTPE